MLGEKLFRERFGRVCISFLFGRYNVLGTLFQARPISNAYFTMVVFAQHRYVQLCPSCRVYTKAGMKGGPDLGVFFRLSHEY